MNSLIPSPLSGTMQFARLSSVDEAAIASFDDNLQYCKISLASVDQVELTGNVDVRFGSKLAASYFAYQLSLEFGRSVAVYTAKDGIHSVVRFAPEQDLDAPAFPLSPDLSSFTLTSTETEKTAKTSPAASNIRKGPPRPMNCWMLFRDTRHKQLKDQFPHLTVQHISTLCSEDWKKLSAAGKEEWRARAKDAKDEHQRMYPDYKYTPRKPGLKKKRQSRKVAQAAMAATAPANITLQGEIQSSSPMDASTMDFTPVDDFGTVSDDFGTASDDMASIINDSLSGGAVQQIEAVDASSQQGPPFHDNEIARQDILDIEFGSSIDFNSLDLFGDDAFAFRAGADASATLPPFSSYMF
ncbi:hypothetical protein PMIN02_002128 [Paraphaeosphaeria minitans]|uniref:HMG box protein n=1 Tax=Paraphaeosphaeria minitans TaxID=565426 RepID=A0A9P6GJG6_9PLEO|nr:HMG box protein [Paraphaeosphaeria minitans]